MLMLMSRSHRTRRNGRNWPKMKKPLQSALISGEDWPNSSSIHNQFQTTGSSAPPPSEAPDPSEAPESIVNFELEQSSLASQPEASKGSSSRGEFYDDCQMQRSEADQRPPINLDGIGGSQSQVPLESSMTTMARNVKWSSFPLILVLTVLLLLLLPSSAAIIFHSEEEATIRCFCDKQTCGGGALVCAGKFCLIGVRTDASGQGRHLEQNCMDESIVGAKTCAREWEDWSEVCICKESLCNTFAFLRGQIDGHHEEAHKQRLSTLMGSEEAMGGAIPRPLYHPNDQEENEDSMREGRHWTGSRGGDMERTIRERDSRSGPHQHSARGAPLVLLLVVLPLVVGAFTVFLVFINYHCKML